MFVVRIVHFQAGPDNLNSALDGHGCGTGHRTTRPKEDLHALYVVLKNISCNAQSECGLFVGSMRVGCIGFDAVFLCRVLQEKILKYPTLPMPYFWRGLQRMRVLQNQKAKLDLEHALQFAKTPVLPMAGICIGSDSQSMDCRGIKAAQGVVLSVPSEMRGGRGESLGTTITLRT